VDDEWIHGSRPEEILNTVTNGVAAKGMPAWGPILGPKRAQAVAAFVVSKKGSAPAVVTDGGEGTENAENTEGTPAVADGGSVPDGATIYATNCAACHGPEMKGLVGPNLTDDEWIHGSDLESIKATITNGVPEKGMTSWGPILGEEQIEIVARYVQSQAEGTP
jgi:mono/diheme cytochrome c family protein